MKLLVFEDLEREVTLFERLGPILRHGGKGQGKMGCLTALVMGLQWTA